MSKINVTAKQLLELDQEIRRPADSIFDILVRKTIEPKLNQFYKKNGERIKSLHEKGAKIMSENFELNEDGSAVSEVIPAVDDKAVDVIFRAINGEMDIADYNYVTNPLNSKINKFTQFPSRIRNFDILSPVAMLLMGEKRKRGLRYTVVARNSNIETFNKLSIQLIKVSDII